MRAGKLWRKLTVAAVTASMLSSSTVYAAVYESSGETVFTFTDSGITVSEGNYSGYKISGTDLTINDSGVYRVSGSCSDGSITVKKKTTGVKLVLDDLSLTSSSTAALACNKFSQADIFIEGEVDLQDSIYNSEDFLVNELGYSEDSDEVDAAENAVIKLKDASKITIGGSGTLNITAKAKNGIKGGSTIELDEDENETAVEPDETSDYYAYLETSDLTMNIDSTAVYDPNDGDTYGDGFNTESYLHLISGTYNIAAGDDAIHCDYTMDIGEENGDDSDLDINVTEAEEGIEAANISFYSGDIDVTANDDAVNAANSDLEDSHWQYSLDVCGGDIYADSESGDGLDSNGTLTISGGRTVVFSGNSSSEMPFDTGTDGDSQIDDSFTITGGSVFGVGYSGTGLSPESGSQDWVSWGSGNSSGPGNFFETLASSISFGPGDDSNRPGDNSGQPGDNNDQPGDNTGSNDSTNMSDSSDIKLYIGTNSYSVGSNVSISKGNTIAVKNSYTTLESAEALRTASYVFYSGDMDSDGTEDDEDNSTDDSDNDSSSDNDADSSEDTDDSTSDDSQSENTRDDSSSDDSSSDDSSSDDSSSDNESSKSSINVDDGYRTEQYGDYTIRYPESLSYNGKKQKLDDITISYNRINYEAKSVKYKSNKNAGTAKFMVSKINSTDKNIKKALKGQWFEFEIAPLELDSSNTKLKYNSSGTLVKVLAYVRNKYRRVPKKMMTIENTSVTFSGNYTGTIIFTEN